MHFLRKYFLIILIVLLLISNSITCYLWVHDAQNENDFAALKKKYPLISQRVLSDQYQNDITVNFLPLRQQIHQIVEPYASDFALYFEYLPSGTSVGINEDSEFTAASLLKVPVVMAYYHKKEIAGINADSDVQIKETELNKQFGDLYKKGAGATINLADAVKYALQKSDNTASLILADQFSNDDFRYIDEGLDIDLKAVNNSPVVTAQEYASILKALYFSSILDLDDSQKILDLMTKTEFRDMLPSGVPNNVPVAHKIGLIDKQIYQDCGIVYVPNRPYILCMISKSDKKTAEERMSTISKMVYEYVEGFK